MAYKLAVVGAGLLGTRIAGELALQGCTVHVYDGSPLTLQTLHSIVDQQLQQLRDCGLLPPDQQLRGSVVPESILSGAVTDADIVFEAVTEDLGIKRGLFKDIASVCSKETILCTSTLSLALADVFADISSPERTLGVRYLYPVYLIDSVEGSFHQQTSDETISRVQEFLKSVKKMMYSRMPGEQPRILHQEEAPCK